MLAEISDLHFKDCCLGENDALRINRNLDPKAFDSYFNGLVKEARENQVKKVHLVLAGDVFEMYRSQLWFQNDVRPYLSLSEIIPGSGMETMVLRILDAISEEEYVGETLAMFRKLPQKFDIEFELHYLLGNHDRLLNATPATRSKARQLLGIRGGEELLPVTFRYQENGRPLAFVRHGQEYDKISFGANYQDAELIPEVIPWEDYGLPALGDFLTIDFTNRLPFLFIELHGAQNIAADPVLTALYHRIVEFEDVRPLRAMLPFLLTTPGLSERQVWEKLEPVFIRLLEEVSQSEFFLQQLDRLDKLGAGGVDLLWLLFPLHIWRLGIPYRLVRLFGRNLTRNITLPQPAQYAAREEVLQQNGDSVRCIISGHTHFPGVSLLDSEDGVERYHINTGTWQNQVPSSPSLLHFGRIKSLANVIVFDEHENLGHSGKQHTWSFNYWSGYSQRFYS